MEEEQPIMVSVIEAARLLGIGRTQLYRLLSQGRLPSTNALGRRRLVKVADLRRFAEGLPATPVTHDATGPPKDSGEAASGS